MPRRPPTIRRWTLKLARVGVCLLAGAVITWGVAWGCALASFDGPRAEVVDKVPITGTGEFDVVAQRSRGFGYEWWSLTNYSVMSAYETSQWRRLPPVAPHPLRDWMIVESDVADSFTAFSGWPAVCLYTKTDDKPPYEDPIGIVTPKGELPLRILPLGFTLNTLLAAGVMLGVLEGIAFARRRVRRAKGRCPSCGYDRGGLASDAAACPECGAASG